jgi:hypothetical protein
MASKIAYDTSSDALLRPAHNAVFFQGWVPEVDNRNHDLLCAEMSRLAYAPRDVIERSLQDIGFSVPGHIGGESLEERKASLGTQGFVAHNPEDGLTVLAFRGTESDKPEDLLVDGETFQRERPQSEGCRVHSGFARCWDRVSDRVNQLLANRQDTLLVTGHSLGAALATLAAIDVKPTKLITFGSPLVGNEKLGALLAGTKIRRYVNCCDLIARIPPEELDREHVGQLLEELADLDTLGHFGGFARGAIQVNSSVFTSVLHILHLETHFTHVAPALYIDQTGTIQRQIRDEDRIQDQETARRSFTRTAASAPLRDLADHTPINYVSAFTGRL